MKGHEARGPIPTVAAWPPLQTSLCPVNLSAHRGEDSSGCIVRLNSVSDRMDECLVQCLAPGRRRTGGDR